MIEAVMRHLRNWFLIPEGIHSGSWEIDSGSISLPFLQDGQYFRICGSVFNDGVYQYPTDSLKDEAFEGNIWALAVPQDFLSIVAEIEAWQEKNGEPSAFTSESFQGYSYNRATNSNGNGIDWQTAFGSRLNAWRKL